MNLSKLLNLPKKTTKQQQQQKWKKQAVNHALVQMIKVIYAHECRVPGQIMYRLIWINI